MTLFCSKKSSNIKDDIYLYVLFYSIFSKRYQFFLFLKLCTVSLKYCTMYTPLQFIQMKCKSQLTTKSWSIKLMFKVIF